MVGDTKNYANELALIACVTVLSTTDTAIDTVGDTTFHAYTEGIATVSYVAGLSVSIPLTGNIVPNAQGTATAEATLACNYLVGGPLCPLAGPPAPAPAPCPVTLPPSGGVVGQTTAYGNAACALAVGGANAQIASATAAVGAVAGAAGGVVAGAQTFAGERVASTQAYAADQAGNAGQVVATATWAAGATQAATCTYLVGNTACTI